MIKTFKFISLATAALTVAGCANTNTVTRNSTEALTFHQDAELAGLPADQAFALNTQARKIVQGSSMRGAAVGAAVGCGVGVATGNSSKCLTSAAGGALIGNAKGRQSVSERLGLSGSTQLARDIRAADTQILSLKSALPVHLATQDAELRRDRQALAAGTINKAEYDRRVNVVRKNRTAIAEALTLTAQQTHRASQNLSEAATKGQTGLDWHITRTGNIAQQATSARSTISLL